MDVFCKKRRKKASELLFNVLIWSSTHFPPSTMETEATNGLPPQQQHYTQEKNAFTVKAARNLNAAAFAGLPLVTDTVMRGGLSTSLLRWRGALSIKLTQRATAAICTFYIN